LKQLNINPKKKVFWYVWCFDCLHTLEMR
jgi:hypothetical protein